MQSHASPLQTTVTHVTPGTNASAWVRAARTWCIGVPDGGKHPDGVATARVELVNSVLGLVRRMDRHPIDNSSLASALDAAVCRFNVRTAE